MSGKGLPGFLRRSLRRNFEEEDEDERLSSSNDEYKQAPQAASLDPPTSDNNGARSTPISAKNGITEIPEESEVPLPSRTKRSTLIIDDIEKGGAGSGGSSIGMDEHTCDNSTLDSGHITADKTPSPGPPSRYTSDQSGISSLGATSASGDDNTTTQPDDDEWIESSGASLPPRGIMERKYSYRETQFDKIISNDVVKMTELRKISWNGIPPQHRGTAWKVMLGYLPTNASRRQQTLERKREEYRDAIAQHYDIDDDSRTLQEQETLRQVLVDVPRTAPEIALFRNERIRRSLARLLYIWAIRHPASSYVQGINDLATPLVAVFLSECYDGENVLDGNIMVLLPDEKLDQVEADVYYCLTSILSGIQDHYTADQPGVQRMVMRLEELVNRIDADLCAHLNSVGIQFLQFAFKWMNCLLLREFSLKCVVRLWDTYISEDGFEDFHVYVCAAFLCQFSNQLQGMDFDELFGFMQQMPTQDWGDTEIEMLLSQAYVLSTLFGGSDAHLTSTPHP